MDNVQSNTTEEGLNKKYKELKNLIDSAKGLDILDGFKIKRMLTDLYYDTKICLFEKGIKVASDIYNENK